MECVHVYVFKFFFWGGVFSRSVLSDSAAPWTVASQASPSFTISWNLLKLTSIESVMPSNHLQVKEKQT